jgi:nucleoside-diphosphate-sugar epimerase
MVESSKPIVLITGVSGYLGSHVALVFLKDGGFNVRGTVRDTKNANKIEPNFENTTLKYLIKISPIT